MKTKYIFILLLLLIFGCKKKDISNIEKNKIFGKWLVTELKINTENEHTGIDIKSKEEFKSHYTDVISDQEAAKSVESDGLGYLLLLLFKDDFNTNVFSKFEISPQNIKVFDKFNNLTEESNVLKYSEINKYQQKIIFDKGGYALAEYRNGFLILKNSFITFYLIKQE